MRKTRKLYYKHYKSCSQETATLFEEMSEDDLCKYAITVCKEDKQLELITLLRHWFAVSNNARHYFTAKQRDYVSERKRKAYRTLMAMYGNKSMTSPVSRTFLIVACEVNNLDKTEFDRDFDLLVTLTSNDMTRFLRLAPLSVSYITALVDNVYTLTQSQVLFLYKKVANHPLGLRAFSAPYKNMVTRCLFSAFVSHPNCADEIKREVFMLME